MSKGINLLKTEKKISVTLASQKLNLLRIISVGILFSVSAVSIILFILVVLSPLPDLQKQEKSLRATIAASHPDIAKLFLINDRLKSSQVIIAKRENFDKSLALLKSRMPNGVFITAMSLDKKQVSVSVASSSLEALDGFLNNLIAAVDEKKDFSKVTMTNLLADELGSRFSVTVEVISL